MPGARVVKAFNTLYGRVAAQNPRHTDGRLVVFLAGDDADARAIVSAFADSPGFAPSTLADCAQDDSRRSAAVRCQGPTSSRSHRRNEGPPRSGADPRAHVA